MVKLIIRHFFQGKKFPSLSPSEFEQAIKKADKAVILDVRTKAEYQRGKLPNALNIDINSPNFRKRIQYLRKKNCFVYCQSGMRSRRACHIMLDMGFEQMTNLKGGFRLWEGRVI